MAGYVGNVPVPQSVREDQSFTATAGQTTFNTLGYTDGTRIKVTLNGVLLEGGGVDYTATNGSDIVLTSAAAVDDILRFETFNEFTLVGQALTTPTISGGTLKSNVTLKNDTEQDTDGGRASKIIYQGEQSGGEISTLAEIQASHDGTADDEKADLIFRTNDGSDGTSPTERMRIDSSGNITHTTSGNSELKHRITNDDSGTAAEANLYITNASSDNAGVFVGATGTGFTTASGFVQDGAHIGSGSGASGGLSIMTRANADMRFYTNGHTNERMKIDASGNVYINNGTLYLDDDGSHNGIINSPASFRVNIDSDNGATGETFTVGHNQTAINDSNVLFRVLDDGKVLVGKTAGAASSATGIELHPANGGAYSTLTSGNTWHVHDTSSYNFYVNSNGGIYNYQANNSNLSDEREKKNIETLDDKWDTVKAWSLKKFHYNSEEDSDPKKIGVIAQDLETNHPELITDYQKTDDETRKSVKEQQMMWMAIKALQEAMAKIETLETKVAALEAE